MTNFYYHINYDSSTFEKKQVEVTTTQIAGTSADEWCNDDTDGIKMVQIIPFQRIFPLFFVSFLFAKKKVLVPSEKTFWSKLISLSFLCYVPGLNFFVSNNAMCYRASLKTRVFFFSNIKIKHLHVNNLYCNLLIFLFFSPVQSSVIKKKENTTGLLQGSIDMTMSLFAVR